MSAFGFICRSSKISSSPVCMTKDQTALYYFKMNFLHNDDYTNINQEELALVVANSIESEKEIYDYDDLDDLDDLDYSKTDSGSEFDCIYSSDSDEDIKQMYIDGISWNKYVNKNRYKLAQTASVSEGNCSNHQQAVVTHSTPNCFKKSELKITLSDENCPHQPYFDWNNNCYANDYENDSTAGIKQCKLLSLNNNVWRTNNNSCYPIYGDGKIKNKNEKILGSHMYNKNINIFKPGHQRKFSCSEIFYSSSENKKESKKTEENESWSRQINENCRVTYYKNKNSGEQSHYKLECKENGRKTPFTHNDNLSTGQKLIGAVLSLLVVVVAAYGSIFFMSIAATVVIGFAAILFILSCYQIIKKSWRNRKR